MERLKPNITLGLNEEQVNERIQNKCVNYKVEITTKSYSRILYDNIFTLFNMINLVLGLLIVYTGQYKNLTFFMVAVINTLISSFQEFRSKRTIDKLSVLATTKSNVIRNGKEMQISIHDLVLDDIVKYKLGNQVSCDSIIREGTVEVDESFITGESNHIMKTNGDPLLSGSFIVSGSCIGQIISVGEENYTNKISKEAKYLKKVKSEIMHTLNKIIKFISIVIIPLGLLLFINQVKISSTNEAIVSTVAALIGCIPEGLVLLTSTVMAVSAVRLAHQKVLVQELYCIENLARVDVICLDKTGTLTTGDMHVSDVISLNEKHNIKEVMNNISSFMDDSNATSRAIKEYFIGECTYDLVNQIPFSSDKKCSMYEFNDHVYVVGAPEFINQVSDTKEYEKYNEDFRVLYVGISKGKIKNNTYKGSFEPVGLILIEDTLRNNSKETIDYLISQDVDVKIISGDNVKTISKIAKKIGLTDVKIFDMTKVDENTNLKEIVEEYNIFGRVTPSQKKDLVIALKANGHMVAMTGDGVNDVLSLKEADCSIAMASGSDAARNVSQIVLLNSDFKSIPNIVKEGRRSINNLERSASLFLTKTLYAIIIAFIFVFIKLDYPFIPIQLTLISVLTIGIPSFILALEPNHNRVHGKFIINVISKSIPAALTIVANIISVIIIAKIYNLTANYTSTMSVILVAFTGFMLLFRVCKPFNDLRFGMYVALVLSFFVGAIGFSKLFELILLTPFQFIFIAIACIIDIIIFKAITAICTKKIFKHEERIVK